MGLLRGFVFYLDLRGLLAALAVTAAVSYSLLGGAATAGLSESEDTLATNLRQEYVLASRPGFGPIALDEIPGTPASALSMASLNGSTVYAVRLGGPGVTNESNATVGLSSRLEVGDNFTIGAHRFVVNESRARLGAGNDWLEVAPTWLDRNAPATQGVVHVLVYDAQSGMEPTLRGLGFDTVSAPGAVSFFREGVGQLIGTLYLSVAGSAVVVGILGGSYVSLEAHARRKEFATLKMFGGSRLVVRLLVARALFLSVVGIGSGLVVTYVVVRLLRRAQFSAAAFPTEFAAWAVPTLLVGAVIGIIPALLGAVRRLRVSELRGKAPRAKAGFLRPILTSKRAAIAWGLASMILAGSMGVLFGIVDAPRNLLEHPGTEVLASTQGNPLHGRVSEFVGVHLAEVEGFEASSPELFCPTLIAGDPVMVRGVEWTYFSRIESLPPMPGPAEDQMLLGSRLARRLGAEVGQEFLVPSCYGTGAFWIRVGGIVGLPGSLNDEAIVPLALARSMSDARAGDVNIVRFRSTIDDDTVPGRTTELPIGIEAVSLRAEPAHPAPLQPSTAFVRVINFSPETRTRALTLQVNGVEVADAWVTLSGETIDEVAIPFEAPLTNPIRLAVNPTTETSPGSSAYAITVPEPILIGSEVEVRVVGVDGAPRSAVNVSLDDLHSTTDEDGRAKIAGTILGKRSLRAEGPDGFGARVVRVVDPNDTGRSHLVIRHIDGPPQGSVAGWTGVVYLENVGGQGHVGVASINVDGVPQGGPNVSIPAGETRRGEFQLILAEGTHVIGDPPMSLTVSIQAQSSVQDPDEVPAEIINDPEALLQLRRERSQRAATAQEDPLTRFLGDTVQNFDAALTLVVLVTLAHAGFAFVFSVRRELEERAPNLATLLALGATSGQIRVRIIREFAFVALIASLIGTGLGLLLAQAAATLGFLVGFGHALTPRLDFVFFAQLVVVGVGSIVAAALIQSDPMLRKSHEELRVGGPARKDRPSLARLLEPRP